MKSLTAYCRRTVLAAAREYAPRDKAYRGDTRRAALESAFKDALHGTETGWWNDLIFNVDVNRLANFYRADIAAAVRDFLSETGAKLGENCDRDGELTWADVLAATGRRYSMADYVGDNGRDRETAARALHWGLRFAVEYITGDLARKYAPDL